MPRHPPFRFTALAHTIRILVTRSGRRATTIVTRSIPSGKLTGWGLVNGLSRRQERPDPAGQCRPRVSLPRSRWKWATQHGRVVTAVTSAEWRPIWRAYQARKAALAA